MKKYLLPLIFSTAIFALCLPDAFAHSPNSSQLMMTNDQPDERKEEINPRELPEEARMDIVDNYHNAKILKAYKLFRDGKFDGYVVDVQKGPKNWTIQYDVDGNAVNKINPIKS